MMDTLPRNDIFGYMDYNQQSADWINEVFDKYDIPRADGTGELNRLLNKPRGSGLMASPITELDKWKALALTLSREHESALKPGGKGRTEYTDQQLFQDVAEELVANDISENEALRTLFGDTDGDPMHAPEGRRFRRLKKKYPTRWQHTLRTAREQFAEGVDEAD